MLLQRFSQVNMDNRARESVCHVYNWFTYFEGKKPFEDVFESSPHFVITLTFYQQAISRVDSRPKLERYLKRFCRRLICCEFFLSLKPVPTPCPDQCQADGGYIKSLYLVKQRYARTVGLYHQKEYRLYSLCAAPKGVILSGFGLKKGIDFGLWCGIGYDFHSEFVLGMFSRNYFCTHQIGKTSALF